MNWLIHCLEFTHWKGEEGVPFGRDNHKSDGIIQHYVCAQQATTTGENQPH